MILITKEAAEEIEANIEEYKIYDRQYLKPNEATQWWFLYS